MADDARTEARLWFIQALVDHRLVGERCKCGSNAYPARDHELHLADALVALFPESAWSERIGDYRGPFPPPPEVVTSRQLVLRGPVEPAVDPEEKP